MKYKLMICIAIMLTVFLGVNVIAFANLENITINNIEYENSNSNGINNYTYNNSEFDYQGTTTGSVLVSASQVKLEERRNIITTTVWAVVGTVILYFSGKVLAYFRLYNRYRKKIKENPENKEIKKPKIEIKLKYIFILFVVIDVLLWTIIIFR